MAGLPGKATTTQCEQRPLHLEPCGLLLTFIYERWGVHGWHGRRKWGSSHCKLQEVCGDLTKQLQTKLHGVGLWKRSNNHYGYFDIAFLTNSGFWWCFFVRPLGFPWADRCRVLLFDHDLAETGPDIESLNHCHCHCHRIDSSLPAEPGAIIQISNWPDATLQSVAGAPWLFCRSRSYQ